MKIKELVRWGVPALAFVAYFKWGGLGLSLVLAGILFAIISAFINWHRKDPQAFHEGMRAWIVVLLLLPAIALTVISAASSPVFLIASFPLLLIVIRILVVNNKKIKEARTAVPFDKTRDLQDFMQAKHMREDRELREKIKADERAFQEEMKAIREGRYMPHDSKDPQPPSIHLK